MFALDQEVIDHYSPGYAMYPPTLIIEGLAQLGGILVAEKFEFEKRVVLAKVGKAVSMPRSPGDQLQFHVQIQSTQENGAVVNCTSVCENKPQADIDLMFAFLEEGHLISGPLFEPGEFGRHAAHDEFLSRCRRPRRESAETARQRLINQNSRSPFLTGICDHCRRPVWAVSWFRITTILGWKIHHLPPRLVSADSTS